MCATWRSMIPPQPPEHGGFLFRARQQVGRGADRRQRIAQLVRHRGQELDLPAVCLLGPGLQFVGL
jgi:hypothetical protein